MKNFIDDEKIVDVVVGDKGFCLDSIEIGLDLGLRLEWKMNFIVVLI